MINAGFRDVELEFMQVPIGTWPDQVLIRDVGFLQLENSVHVIEAFGLGMFTRIVGWSLENTMGVVRTM